MGVVKNLMVRIGADVRGVVGGMKTAYQSTRQATSQIKAATADMKRSVKDSFSGSRMSIREYKETIAGVKASQNAAMQNAERLQEKLSHLQSVYDSLADATAGLDLSTPLTAQIKEAEESWHGFLNEAQKVKDALKKELDSGGNKDNSEKITNLRQQLQSLREKAGEAELELRNLKAVAAAIGSENIGFASTSGMGSLRSDMEKTQRELEISQIKAGELGQRLKALSVPQMIKSELKSIGAAAASAARTGVAQLGSRLKSLAGSAVRGIVTLPLQLLGIGRSAAAGSTSLEKMVRSIRNIGAVSLGLRVVGGIFRGIFGELQGIISSYISQNDELSATISNMKAQLGQALAPAINAVIAVMRRLMPVIQTIASVINGIFTTLFGKVKSTTSGVKSSAAAAKSAASTAVAAAKQLDLYSFDQINRQSDDSQDSGADDIGGGFDPESLFDLTPPKWLDSVLDWINQMKAAFKAGDWEGLGRIFGEGINKAVDAINAVDIGKKVGTFVSNLFTTLNSALATIDFFNIGKKVGEFVTSGFQAVNWNTVGETIGRALTAQPSVIVGFILSTDWSLIGQSLSDLLSSALTTVGEWIRSVDWIRIGESIWDFISGIDFASIAQGLFSLFGSALSAGIGTITGFIGGIVNDIKEFFAKRIEECGGNVALGFLKGLFDGLCNLGEWIYENIVNPFFTALCSGFGIHSPSTVMHEHGENVILGFLNGILEALSNIGSWIGDHIVTPFLKWITTLFGISDHSSTLKGLGKDLISGLLDGMTQAWASVESFLDTKISGLEQKFSQGWTKIGTSTATSWKDIGNAVTEQLKVMQQSAAEQTENLRQQLLQSWGNILSDGKTYLGQLSQSMKTEFLTMRTDSSKTFSDLRNDLQRTWTSITSQQNSSLNVMSSQFKKTHALMDTTATTYWQLIQKTVTTKTDSILTTMESFRFRISESFKSMNVTVSNAMTVMVGNMSDGFVNMLVNIQNCINSVIIGVSNMVSAVVTSVTQAANAISRLESYGGSYSSYSSGSGSSAGASAASTYTGTVVKLASGGVVDGPTPALVGEAGKEAVVPLERNTGWMDTLAQRIAATSGSSRETPVVLKIYLGGKKVSQQVIKDINSITQTTGICPINV